MSVYRVSQTEGKPLASYLQPSRAGFAPAEDSVRSAPLTGTQVIGIVIAIGCLLLLLLSRTLPSTAREFPGRGHEVVSIQGQGTIQGEVRSSR
jgi:hypothetical protein